VLARCQAPRTLRTRLKRDPELFLLAGDGERLVGSLMGGWDGWRGNMYRLAVDPAYQRLGIARRLIAAVEAALWQLGATRLTSLVFADDRRAAAFWHSVGYLPDPARERYVKDLQLR
jgi:ribosomal protein S18 acetylase RimI-like enzyme